MMLFHVTLYGIKVFRRSVSLGRMKRLVLEVSYEYSKTEFHTRVILTSNIGSTIHSSESVVITEALNCGDRKFDLENQDLRRIDNFMDGLYEVFEKETPRTEEDQFLMQAISNFLGYQVQEITEDTSIETPNELRFVFIVTFPMARENSTRVNSTDVC
ncbi:hypothetical protein EDC94DRAFT_585336 [Helicostylum pulchrum]|nr:hypothetical protein EDC94DRAFT_585336 [Helicostylum pulchrum]